MTHGVAEPPSPSMVAVRQRRAKRRTAWPRTKRCAPGRAPPTRLQLHADGDDRVVA